MVDTFVFVGVQLAAIRTMTTNQQILFQSRDTLLNVSSPHRLFETTLLLKLKRREKGDGDKLSAFTARALKIWAAIKASSIPDK